MLAIRTSFALAFGAAGNDIIAAIDAFFGIQFGNDLRLGRFLIPLLRKQPKRDQNGSNNQSKNQYLPEHFL